MPPAFFDHSLVDGVEWFKPTEYCRGPWDANSCHAGPPSGLIARAVEQLVPAVDSFVAAYESGDDDAAKAQYEAVLDVEERKVLMERVEQIMRDDAFVILPVWQPVYTIAKTTVHGYPPHPTNYHQFNKVWIG